MTRLTALVAGLVADPGPLAADPEVGGIAYDSRRVGPGDLLVVWRGREADGRRFAVEAVARGAVAVMADGPPPEEAPEVPWIETAEPRALLGPLAARLLGDPARHLVVAGVTGTNGKTTVATLVAATLEAAGRPCGLLGTLGHAFRGAELAGGGRTTPEGSDLMAACAALRQAGAGAVAMEVSSHALAQGRLAGLDFDVAGFTNLTRDHLDFHGGMEEYFAAKRRLFERLRPAGRAVVHLADEWGRRLAAELPGALTCGEGGDVAVVSFTLATAETVARLRTPRGEIGLRSRLIGRYNLDNLLVAAAMGEALGLPLAAIADGVAAVGPLPGRLQPVDFGQEMPVYVDYAHTPAALEAALRAVREVARRRVIVVFGCGGERDPGKRPLMGEIAGRLAELPIATSDNPRREDPLAILAAIEEGLRASGNRDYRIVPDRREAIRRAVAVAASGGHAVLVAGKGHEREQLVGGARLPFSDEEEIVQAVAELPGRGPRGGGERER